MKALSDIILPADLRYTDEHIWIKMDGEEAVAGISDFAQDQLGEVVYVDLPSEGDSFSAGDAFGARVYKISRDAQGARLTWLRVTGGELRARAAVKVPTESGETEEKIHQIRLYSGEKYELTDAVKAGTVCAVTGLTAAHSGDALGAEKGKSAGSRYSLTASTRRRPIRTRCSKSCACSRKRTRCCMSCTMRLRGRSACSSWARCSWR